MNRTLAEVQLPNAPRSGFSGTRAGGGAGNYADLNQRVQELGNWARTLTLYLQGTLTDHVNQLNTGTQGFGEDLTAASTIEPYAYMHQVDGTGTIQTVAPPLGFSGSVVLKSVDGFSLAPGGNIDVPSAVTVNPPQYAQLVYQPDKGIWHYTGLGGPFGAATEPPHAVLIGNGPNPVNSVLLGNGQLLIGSTGNDPVAAIPTAGSGIGITPAPGALTIANTGVLSIAGTTNEIAASAPTGAVVLSLAGPWATGTLTAHGVLLGQGSSVITAVAPMAAGSYLMSNGVANDPVWSTLTLPNAANIGDILTATAANTMSTLSAGTAGYALTSQGPGLPPVWAAVSGTGGGAVNSVTGTANQILASPTIGAVVLSLAGPHNYATQTAHGVLLGQGTGAINAVAPGTLGLVLTAQGVGADPIWQAIPPSGVQSVTGTANRITVGGTATNPTVDIAATYAGQASLATVGTITAGTWQGTAVGAPYGGTGQTTYAIGDLLYASSASALSRLAASTSGLVLTANGAGVAPTWQAIPASGVQTVTGTANRITIGGTGANPTVDIASTYVGQASLTTLGTITTGVWNGTAIAATAGGTGQSTYAVGDLLSANTTTTLSRVAAVATGSVLASAGAGVLPAWQSTVYLGGKLGVGETAAASPGGIGQTTLELNGGASNGSMDLITSAVAINSFPGSIAFSTTGTAQADQRAADILCQLTADSTTTPFGQLIFRTANGATLASRMSIGPASVNIKQNPAATGDAVREGGPIGAITPSTGGFTTASASTGYLAGVSTGPVPVVAQYKSDANANNNVAFLASNASNLTLGPTIALRHARGTAIGSETATQASDILGMILFQGFGTTVWGAANTGVRIDGFATEAHTDTARGSAIRFYTVANTTTTLTQALLLNQDTTATFGGAVTVPSLVDNGSLTGKAVATAVAANACTPDLSTGIIQVASNAAALTVNNPTNGAVGMIWMLRLANTSGTTAWTPAFGTAFRVGTAPSIALAKSATFIFYWDGTSHYMMGGVNGI